MPKLHAVILSYTVMSKGKDGCAFLRRGYKQSSSSMAMPSKGARDSSLLARSRNATG